MSFDSEWAGLKHEASVRMNLAQAGEGGNSGGSGDLKSSKSPWNTAASGVGDIRGNLKTGVETLLEKQKGAGPGSAGVDGLVSATTLQSVLTSWEQRLDLVSRECGELKGKLQKAGDDHYKNDEAISAAFEEQRTKPSDTPPGGPTSQNGG